MGEIREIDLSAGAGGTIGRGAIVRARTFTAVGRFTLGDEVVIEAEEVVLGDGAVVERGTTASGIRGAMERFALGDETFIGFNNQILVPRFEMGDYSQIHNSCLSSGYKFLTIGHNCWIGQSTILNSTERLTLGDNVRIGTQSQLWTHVASGELLEGCLLFGEKPLTLEDNVWIVGGAVISPGLVVARNSVVMTGSVLTKSTEAFHVYAGSPAKDVSEKIRVWKDVDVDEKLMLIADYAAEFTDTHPRFEGRIAILDLRGTDGADALDRAAALEDQVLIVDALPAGFVAPAAGASIFDLTSKRYVKRRTEVEKQWIRFNVGYRARFVPAAGDRQRG